MAKRKSAKHMSYVGARIYGSAHKLKAIRFYNAARNSAAAGSAKMRGPAANNDSGDEVSEEIIVYGSSSGGGTDVIQLDPWMFEFHVEIKVPPTITIPPTNPTEPEPSPDDPCEQLQVAVDSLNEGIAADELVITILDDMIANETDPQKKKELKQDRREAKQHKKESEELLKEVKAAQKEQGC